MITYSIPFFILDYKISHSKLLLRGELNNKNIDVVFYGITYMDIGITLDQLSISLCSQEDMLRFESKIELFNSLKYFKLKTSIKEYFVVAGFIEVYSNSFDVNSSSLEREDKGQLIQKVP